MDPYIKIILKGFAVYCAFLGLLFVLGLIGGWVIP